MLYIFIWLCRFGDYDIDLPGNYSVIRTSANEVTIAQKTEEGWWGEDLIPSKVVEVGWNNRFIYCKQIEPSTEEDYYWILNIDSEEIEGPLEYDEFVSKLGEYSIGEIELKEVESLRK